MQSKAQNMSEVAKNGDFCSEGERKSSTSERKCFVHDQFLMDFLRNGPSCIVCKKERKN